MCSDGVSVGGVYKKNGISVRVCNRRSLYRSKFPVPFMRRVTVISRCLRGRKCRFTGPFRGGTINLVRSVCGACRERGRGSYTSSIYIRCSLFSRLFCIPFLPVRDPGFAFVSLFTKVKKFHVTVRGLKLSLVRVSRPAEGDPV